MADSLYLNLWWPSFTEAEMMPRVECVLRHFPFSHQHPGIGYFAVHSVSWNEPVVSQETFDYQVTPEQAVALAGEFLHDDNGYIFEAAWDLWSPGLEYDSWISKPRTVKFLVHGMNFDEGIYNESGHLQIDFGLDSGFLFDEMELTEIGQERIKENIAKLVVFSAAIEKNCGISARLLWSESEENLAQKLISRLQKLN
jgi:hypothetical protein